MNYYASGGQAHGLSTLKGHSIQTKDGVPSFGLGGWFQKNIVQPVVKPTVQAVKAVQNIPGIKQVSDVATQAVRPIDQALVGLDKAVGRAIPGGWGTIGTIAASMIPGGQFAALGLGKTAAMTGLGALTGSGVLRPGRSFNLQGAMMGGAMAYGASQLADYAAAAGGAGESSKAAMLPQSEYVPSEYLRGTSIGPDAAVTNQVPVSSAVLSAPDMQVNLAKPVIEPGIQIPTPGSSTVGIGGYAPTQSMLEKAGTYVSNIPSKVGDFVSNIPSNVAEFADKATTPSTYANFGDAYAKNVSDIGSGINKLLTTEGAAKAASTATGINPIQAAGALGYGATGLAALDEQEKYLKEQLAAQKIAQADYDQALANINQQRDYAQSVVNQSPFNPNPNRDVSIGETYYRRSGEKENLYGRNPSLLYAVGGSVDDELGMDSARGLDTGNMQKGLFGMGYAAGGTPRFLSGGGDGMSDSIPATINDKQPARLADGEFVIPADVVSHLGNGSSKAGAKQLYSMMDKVRQARTGRKSQGKEINPRKFMPA